MITEEQIMAALNECYDPEIPGVSIVDLGFIYGVEIDSSKVKVKMTLTTPGCPMSRMMLENAKSKVENINGIEEVEMELVWDPPWNPSMMNDKAKKKLGFM